MVMYNFYKRGFGLSLVGLLICFGFLIGKGSFDVLSTVALGIFFLMFLGIISLIEFAESEEKKVGKVNADVKETIE